MKFTTTIKNGLILFLISTIAFYAETSAQSGNKKLLWQIGTPDNAATEFALHKDNEYKNFVPRGFGGTDRSYIIGQSDPADDWPCILPGPMDGFAGYGFWAGRALTQLPVYFNITELDDKGSCILEVNILSVNSSQAPLFRCTINGKKYDSQLKTCNDKNTPDNFKNCTQQLRFEIPASLLKKGINEIIFQNMTGNWCVFDCIQWYGPASVKIAPPGNTLIQSVSFSEKETTKDKNHYLPLHIELLHKGKPVSVRAIVDNIELELLAEQGRSILEFNFPAVEKTKKSKVKVFVNGELKFENRLTRKPGNPVRMSDYVNQFMGTSGSRWMIAPGPWMPMSMVKISPDNEDSNWKAGYDYQVENIMGFSHVHEWTMAGLLMMPANGALYTQPGPENDPDLGYRSRIDKENEIAEVGRYKTKLLDYDIDVELTATTRASMQRYLFPKGKENRVLVDLHFPAEYVWELRDAQVTRVSDTEIEGWALSHCSGTGYAGSQDYTLHFVIQFNKPFKNMGGWVMDRVVSNTDRIDKKTYEPNWTNRLKDFKITDAGAFVNFSSDCKEVLVRTGISLVSTEQARLNLNKEMAEPFGWDFEKIVVNQKNAWDNIFNRVEIETTDYLQKEKFYTNMYRAVCGRNTWSDVNGKWVDMNEQVQTSNPDKPLFGSDGYWGWQWNLVPFYNLILPEFSSNWINTYLEMYDKGGWLPIGNPGMEYYQVMVGQPAIPLIVSAYQHGISDFDKDKMYKAIYHQQTSLMENHPGGSKVGNESYNYYLDLGYVPLNREPHSYVSNTMEYAYQDWCFAQYAKALNIDSTYNTFMKRSENWRNIFDVETGFVRPKNKDGDWIENFDPYHSPGFCESNSWQFSWYVPHNLSGLIKSIGKKRFVSRLEKAMEESEKIYFNALSDNFSKYPINHGNQSNMQSSYIFNHADEPWLTQKWTRAIQEKYYGAGPRNAYPGDEDQGQMSAWFVMSTIGLFEMDGGASAEPYYELGSPRFEKVTIHLSDKYYDGNTFTIEAKNASRENKYIHSASLNGKELKSWRFPVKKLQQGGTLILDMKSVPDKKLLKNAE
ncbi:GH92 family glycosyl hydrolase [Zhouia spongiae]|uniref:GH92 family glycosyl hydrolase n=1 Tax=Zhouia spongiae TaxID=2202721 RepID=A0ABY3YP29_9FLAO|nr:GH92 family glycosyl hydrolase [Zhouia spongiae]UNY99607.1 GH92 family glycosyl hydrolase [Zhouia spongiae]